MKLVLPTRFIGTFTAIAIAATTFTAAPAYADNDRAARTVATLLGLAVVGKIIHDNRDRQGGHVTVTNPGRNLGHGTVSPRPRSQGVHRAALPARCLRSFQTRGGEVRMFGRRCLEQNYRAVNRLPQSCAQHIRTDRGTRSGFGARCLRRNGFRISQR